MSSINRRTLLGGAALGAAAALSPVGIARGQPEGPGCAPLPNDPTAPGVSRGWDAPPSTLPSDPSNCPIDHVGILMMENRSYDTYFGWLEGGRGFLNLGLDLSYVEPDDPGVAHRPEHWAPIYRRCGHPDPDHGWVGGRQQLQDGFLAGRNDEYALAYYMPEDIPAYARLARQFTVFDRYFCSLLGPTYPNRHYQHAATSGGLRTTTFPPDEAFQVPPGFRFPTIWDRLDAAGLSSAYYFVDLPFIAMYAEKHLDKMRPISQFYVDAANGQLPNVFFVEPKFLGDQRTDDHPGGADINSAQAFVNNVVRAMTTSPQWARSAFFVNYDEWGGFFDHVTPPRVPDERASDNIDDDFGQLGFRIPAMAISPYSRTGYVHHDGPYEHTSILKFIEYRWDLEPLTMRDTHARNIGEAFDFAQEPRLDIGLLQLQTPHFYASSGCEEDGEGDGGGESSEFEVLAEALSHLGVHIPDPSPEEVLGLTLGPLSDTQQIVGPAAGEVLSGASGATNTLTGGLGG